LVEEPRPLILLVDDDDQVASILGRIITGGGFEVLRCATPVEALVTAEETDVDAMVIDVHLPQMSGLQLARYLRLRRADASVIAITGSPNFDGAAEAYGIGAVSYLPKPIEQAELLDHVRRAVAMGRLARARREATNLVQSEPPPSFEARGQVALFERVLRETYLVFQPIVDFAAQRTFGFEALLRCRVDGFQSPLRVIELAESVARTDMLGRRIRALAAEALPALAEDVLLFVNLHSSDLLDDKLFDPIGPLARFANRVVLEITERATVSEIPDLQMRVSSLRQLGYRIAVDDLGAGYAGLSSFALLEPDLVKLDMSLVRNIHQSAVRQRMVASMVGLCRDLGNRVVTEGVETVAERDVLAALGCSLMQGYFFARPSAPFPEVDWPARTG
jgi:EAL domain-containing protein (putative c-di-GMP-specific phosphodiesterase class I)